MYTVVIQPPAEAEAEEAYLFIRADSPNNAARWFNGLIDKVQSLKQMPERCRLVPESEAFGQEIRQLLYGAYRILFVIRGNVVHVLHIRHGARKYLRP